MLLIVLKKNKKAKKWKFQNVEDKINQCLDDRKTKMIVKFNDGDSASVKYFAERKKNKSNYNVQVWKATYVR